MKILRGSITICILTMFALVLLAATSWGQQRPPIVEQVAKAYGLDSYAQIDAVRYTFNLEVPALKLKLSHSWEFEPKTNQVTFEGKDKDGKPVKVTYKRTELNAQPDSVKNQIDPAFMNDNYWFMLPFHIYWDTGATVTDKGMQKLPIGTGSGELMSVKYPAESGGYTPGDTWDLYIGKDSRIEAMVYHRGGPTKPSVVTATWAGYKMAGPLLVSTEHKGNADGGALHLTFTGVAVKMAGSDTWMEAK